jgi:DNA-binding NarL/FixJ family response regulator
MSTTTSSALPHVRVLVLHRDAIVAQGILVTLRAQPDLLVQEGSAGHPPLGPLDVIVCDPDTGLALARSGQQVRPRRQERPPARLLVIGEQGSGSAVQHALARGVNGYLPLDGPLDELVLAVHALSQGRRYLGSHLQIAPPPDETLAHDVLTDRECEVLDLLASGECNRAIARQLGIPLSNVKTHVRTLMDKLKAQNRAQAVGVAAQRGLVGLSSRA